MMEKLSQRDKRALKIGAVCVVGILVFMFASDWLEHWRGVRVKLASAQEQLKIISPSEAKREGLLSIVPAFEMPVVEEKQKFLFRDKLNEQLKKAGVKSEPLQILAASKSQGRAGYKLVRLKCDAKCKFSQLLDLLANLKENPYLVGIEQLQMKCDEKKREQIELDLTVSTFVK